MDPTHFGGRQSVMELGETRSSACTLGSSRTTTTEKRRRGSPTGETPIKESKRRSGAQSRSRRQMFMWTDKEDSALIEFVLLTRSDQAWPADKSSAFWDSAAQYVFIRSGSDNKRSGTSCRTRVTKFMAHKYESPLHAEGQLSVLPSVVHDSSCTKTSDYGILGNDCTSGVSVSTQTLPQPLRNPFPLSTSGDHQQTSSDHHNEQVHALSSTFTSVAQGLGFSVPTDFCEHALKAMIALKRSGRSNVLYRLARALSTPRAGCIGSKFPTDRMPMGLLEYMVGFFDSNTSPQVPRCPDDYREWLVTMYSVLGMKWSKLHCGPMWSEQQVSQGITPTNTSIRSIEEARVNIPALGDRTLRREISSSPYTTDSKIQAAALDEAVRLLPEAVWWIKADGVDVVAGLGESVRKEWSGDVDLDDGKLKQMHETYLNRLKSNRCIGLGSRSQHSQLQEDLAKLELDLSDDLAFLSSALRDANNVYSSKLASGKATQQTLFSLGWKVDELSRLTAQGRHVFVECQIIKQRHASLQCNFVAENIPRKLSDLRSQAVSFVEGCTRVRRTAATHLLLFMISPESRNKKPYALPVQCLPYVGMSEDTIRGLANRLISEMTARGMRVAGMVTNGEHNGLRMRGNTRPLHILQIRSDARVKVSRTSVKCLLAMLTPVVLDDGPVTAEQPNEAITEATLQMILDWRRSDVDMDDIIDRLRSRTVPPSYPIHPWNPGRPETRAEKLRSIVAQMMYAYEIDRWDKSGVPFRRHMYVPEVHPITMAPYHEREDEGHVFKRIGSHTRKGGPQQLQVQRFCEAAYDPSTGLTYSALTGQKKQSIGDVERLFNPKVEEFMMAKGYTYEAHYIRTIRNWRRANDERGLSQEERSKFNKDFLCLVLDELIPWHRNFDYCTLEVNRDLSSICGFSRETLIAVTTDIESRETKKVMNMEEGLPPEHPRASTTDDVECFFSILRDCVGKHFTVKQVYYEFRKLSCEFVKRLDPDLSFFYFTSAHDRFQEGPLPGFDQPRPREKKTSKNPRHMRVPRRDQLSTLVPGRTSMVTPGTLSVRAKFHQVPVELPPPPGTNIHAVEHSYSL